MASSLNTCNIEQWSGLSAKYHDDRPVPPEVIIDIVLSWLKRKPDTVVDVGCGTDFLPFYGRILPKPSLGLNLTMT